MNKKKMQLLLEEHDVLKQLSRETLIVALRYNEHLNSIKTLWQLYKHHLKLKYPAEDWELVCPFLIALDQAIDRDFEKDHRVAIEDIIGSFPFVLEEDNDE